MKQGKVQQTLINKEKNECQAECIHNIINKNKCDVIFGEYHQILGKDQDGADNEIQRDKKIAVKKKFEANR